MRNTNKYCSAFPKQGGDEGLTIRQKFAESAMMGILCRFEPSCDDDLNYVAEISVRMSNALIKALNKEAENDKH